MKVDFACIDDTDLDRLPEGVKALVYPMPLEMEEHTYRILLGYVDKGGHLLATRDLSRQPDDAPGCPSRTERLEELFGLEWRGYAFAEASRGQSVYAGRYLPVLSIDPAQSPVQFKDYSFRPWIVAQLKDAEALVSAPNGMPLVTHVVRGDGEAWFTPDTDPDLPHELWAAFLQSAEINRNQIMPDDPTVHLFRTETKDGFVHTVITFPWDSSLRQVAVATGAGEVKLTLRSLSMAMVHANHGGFLDALEAQGDVYVNGKILVKTEAHLMIGSLDGLDLECSEAVMIYPITSGKVVLKNKNIDEAHAGEIAGGQWRIYEEMPVTVQGGAIELDISAIGLTCQILLCSSSGRQKAVELAERALTV